MSKKILQKEMIRKEDGRYLYLYSWAAEEGLRDKGGPEQKQDRLPVKD